MPLKVFNPAVLNQKISEAPERLGKTIRKISMEMGGVSEQYLSRQLNPMDCGAKLGVEDFVYFSAVTDLAALDYIESAFGRVSVPIPPQVTSQKNWFQYISSIAKEAGECVSTLADALADNEINERELSHCKLQTYEALQALAALWVRLQDM